MDVEQIDVLLEFQPSDDSCLLTISDKNGMKLVTKVLPNVSFPQLGASGGPSGTLPYTVSTKVADLRNFHSLIGEIDMDELVARAKASQELAKDGKGKKEILKKTAAKGAPASKPIDVTKKSSKVSNKSVEKKASKGSIKEAVPSVNEVLIDSHDPSNSTVITASDVVDPSMELQNIDIPAVPEAAEMAAAAQEQVGK